VYVDVQASMVYYCAIMEAYNPTFLDTESNSNAAKYEEFF